MLEGTALITYSSYLLFYFLLLAEIHTIVSSQMCTVALQEKLCAAISMTFLVAACVCLRVLSSVYFGEFPSASIHCTSTGYNFCVMK